MPSRGPYAVPLSRALSPSSETLTDILVARSRRPPDGSVRIQESGSGEFSEDQLGLWCIENA